MLLDLANDATRKDFFLVERASDRDHGVPLPSRLSPRREGERQRLSLGIGRGVEPQYSDVVLAVNDKRLGDVPVPAVEIDRDITRALNHMGVGQQEPGGIDNEA